MHKSYALIYTLLFIVLLMITVISTWVIGMADIRMQRRNEYSAEASQLAKAAIDDGWVRYKNLVGSTANKAKYFPDEDSNNVCDPGKVARINPNVSPATQTIVLLATVPPLSETADGRYDLKYCWDSSRNIEVIEGIGYFMGNKITLKADVNHTKDTNYCSNSLYTDQTSCTSNGGSWLTDHSADYLTIFQTGPS